MGEWVCGEGGVRGEMEGSTCMEEEYERAVRFLSGMLSCLSNVLERVIK